MVILSLYILSDNTGNLREIRHVKDFVKPPQKKTREFQLVEDSRSCCPKNFELL
jgi:hypothetical protein